MFSAVEWRKLTSIRHDGVFAILPDGCSEEINCTAGGTPVRSRLASIRTGLESRPTSEIRRRFVKFMLTGLDCRRGLSPVSSDRA